MKYVTVAWIATVHPGPDRASRTSAFHQPGIAPIQARVPKCSVEAAATAQAEATASARVAGAMRAAPPPPDRRPGSAVENAAESKVSIQKENNLLRRIYYSVQKIPKRRRIS